MMLPLVSQSALAVHHNLLLGQVSQFLPGPDKPQTSHEPGLEPAGTLDNGPFVPLGPVARARTHRHKHARENKDRPSRRRPPAARSQTLSSRRTRLNLNETVWSAQRRHRHSGEGLVQALPWASCVACLRRALSSSYNPR